MTAASPLSAAPSAPGLASNGLVPPGSLLGSSSFLLNEFSAKGPIFSVAITKLMMFVGYHNGIIGGFPLAITQTPGASGDSGPLIDTNVVAEEGEGSAAPTLEMAAHSGVVRQLTVHDATQRLYSCSSDGSIKSWSIPECAWVMSFEAVGGTPVHCFVLDAKGSTLYSGDEAGAVTMWNAETGVATQTMRCHYGAIHALQIPTMPPPPKPVEGETIVEEEQEPPPRPNCLLTASSDGQIKLIEPSTKLVHVLMKADVPVCCILYAHPNVIAGCSDGTIRGFNIHSAAPTMIYRGHTDGVNQVLVIRKRLVSVSDDTTIGIWNPRTWNRELSLKGHDRCVSSAIIAPSEMELLTAGFDGIVRTWNVAAVMEHLTATGETIAASPKKKKKPEGKASKKKK